MSNEFVKISDLPVAKSVADTDLFIIETLTGTKSVTREVMKGETESLTKEDVGLGNVDNTADLDKPVSTATQTALNAKLDSSTAGSLYVTKTEASNTYLTQNSASGTYLSQANAGTYYLTKSDAATDYATKSHTHTKLQITDFPTIPTVVDTYSATGSDPVSGKAVAAALETVPDNDTKNTAGATDTSSKIFLVGTTSQEANPQSYSHDTVFVDTSGQLNSANPSANENSTVVATTKWVSDKGFLVTHQTVKQDGVTGATINRFGICSSLAATQAKTVTITTGTFSLETGARVSVKFNNANTASSPTLNVNETGDKNIFHNGTQITTGSNKAMLAGTVDFVYDGTQWQLIGNYVDTDTTYTSLSQFTDDLGTSPTHTHSQYLTVHQSITEDGITGSIVNRLASCSTSASTAAKTASITSGTFSLEAGVRVAVNFVNANTADSPTLEINSTSAKNIFHNGAQITSGANKGLLAGICDFIYDGIQWNLVGNYVDTVVTSLGWSNVTDKPSTFAPASHTHAGTEVTLTGYEKASTIAAVATTDTIDVAIGKLEKALDGKQASGSYASASHTHAGTEVTLTGYTMASSISAITTSDTVSTALGKLEKTLDGIETLLSNI